MPVPAPYAVLQRNAARPTAEQIRRAFRSFRHLTDADAVRLAANAQGILQRQLSADAARAFHRALQAEGVAAAIVTEGELRLLPPSRSLHRLGLTEAAFEVYDLYGHPTAVAWRELALVAAGAVRHHELNHPRAERPAIALEPGCGDRPVSRGETGWQLILELVLSAGAVRYEINADEFPFRYALDRPDLSKVEKFVWLVREICRRAAGAILNRGARDVHEGTELVRGYPHRQMFYDEMTWLLWNAAQTKRVAGVERDHDETPS
ncbi:MAG: hypothetical protein IT579_12190 [Verrucomicrobia subdivision 3 bacterium]|nr:hypothetical protein [Limisphaerales bacterium]